MTRWTFMSSTHVPRGLKVHANLHAHSHMEVPKHVAGHMACTCRHLAKERLTTGKARHQVTYIGPLTLDNTLESSCPPSLSPPRHTIVAPSLSPPQLCVATHSHCATFVVKTHGLRIYWAYLWKLGRRMNESAVHKCRYTPGTSRKSRRDTVDHGD